MREVFQERYTDSFLQELDSKWKSIKSQLDSRFEADLDVEGVVFLIGLQELGKGYKKYSKDQKLEILHIGTCTLLEPYGFYEYIGRDEDGYPHWETKEALPHLNPAQQKALMISGILEYFGGIIIAQE